MLSIPPQARVLTQVFPGLHPYAESLELGRLVLDDEVPANGGNRGSSPRYSGRAALVGVRGIVSFSDPMPRAAADGTTITPGHVGTIYQALNAVYTSRGTERSLIVLPGGSIFSARAAQISCVQAPERQLVHAANAQPDQVVIGQVTGLTLTALSGPTRTGLGSSGRTGPATPDHVHYWLGEGLGAGRKWIQSWIAGFGECLAEVDIDGESAFVPREDLEELAATTAVRLLPGYDQGVLGPGTADAHVVPPARRTLVSRQASCVRPGAPLPATGRAC